LWQIQLESLTTAYIGEIVITCRDRKIKEGMLGLTWLVQKINNQNGTGPQRPLQWLQWEE
jgi:hypothetical protein